MDASSSQPPSSVAKFAALGWLYLVQGIPYGLQDKFVPLQLRAQGLDYSSVGAVKAVLVPWVTKGLWAPALQIYGDRRRWLLAALLLLAAASFAGSFCDVSEGLPQVVCVLLLLNVGCAVQDVVVDGLAMLWLQHSQLGLVNSMQVVLYKVGSLCGGGGLMLLLSVSSWRTCLLLLAAVYATTALWVLALPLQARRNRRAGSTRPAGSTEDEDCCSNDTSSAISATKFNVTEQEDEETSSVLNANKFNDVTEQEDEETSSVLNANKFNDVTEQEDEETSSVLSATKFNDVTEQEDDETSSVLNANKFNDVTEQEDDETSSVLNANKFTKVMEQEDNVCVVKRNKSCGSRNRCKKSVLSESSKVEAKADSISSILRVVFAAEGSTWLALYVLLYKMAERGALNNFPIFLLDKGLSMGELSFWNGVMSQILSIAGSVYGGVALSRPSANCSLLLLSHSLQRLLLTVLQTYCVYKGSTSSYIEIGSLNYYASLMSLCYCSFSTGVISTLTFTLMMRYSKRLPEDLQSSHYSVFASIEVAGKLAFATVAGALVDLLGIQNAFAVFSILSVVPVVLIVLEPDYKSAKAF